MDESTKERIFILAAGANILALIFMVISLESAQAY